MLHHEEFPEKPHYNMATPHFPLLPPFLEEMFRHPLTSSSWNIDVSFLRIIKKISKITIPRKSKLSF